jgi:hypothetical protein
MVVTCRGGSFVLYPNDDAMPFVRLLLLIKLSAALLTISPPTDATVLPTATAVLPMYFAASLQSEPVQIILKVIVVPDGSLHTNAYLFRKSSMAFIAFWNSTLRKRRSLVSRSIFATSSALHMMLLRYQEEAKRCRKCDMTYLGGSTDDGTTEIIGARPDEPV